MSPSLAGTTGGDALADPDGLLERDHLGLLRAAASAGALVRATAATVEERALAVLAGHTPRSVVLAAGHGPARHAAALVAAAMAGTSTVAVLAARTVPRWLGPLDVLVVLADDPGELVLAEAVALAGRRGTEVVLAVPDAGPLTTAGGSRALRLPPRVPVADGLELARHVAVALAVLDTLGVRGPARTDAPLDLAALADTLDAEAARDHPGRELFESPAKTLAARVLGRETVLAGAGPVSLVVAEHAASALLRHAGVVAGAAELTDVLAAPRRPAAPGVDPLFHDPELDGPAPAADPRVLVLATERERAPAELRGRVLTDAAVLVAGEPGAEHPAAAAAGVVGELLVLAVRAETAAVYLGLVR